MKRAGGEPGTRKARDLRFADGSPTALLVPSTMRAAPRTTHRVPPPRSAHPVVSGVCKFAK